MAALYKTIPADVETILNAGTYTDTVTVSREWLPSFEPDSLPIAEPWNVYVRSAGLKTIAGTRGKKAETMYTVDVALAAHVQDVTGTAFIDNLCLIVEELQNELIDNPELATFGYLDLSAEPFVNDPVFSDVALREQNVFLSLSQFNYRVLRP